MSQPQPQVDADYLDAEFNVYLRMARNLIQRFRVSEDRKIAEKYIKSCITMKNSDNVKVKFHRNRFFRYFLKTMRKTVDSQTPAVFVNKFDSTSDEAHTTERISENEFRQWSANRKSYVSAKILPGFGVLLFMACTDHPDCGWTENGFTNFASDISDVPNPSSRHEESMEH